MSNLAQGRALQLNTAGWGTLSVSIELVDDKLPTEFRIFQAGINTSLNGDFLFDEEAAADVMTAAANHAVRFMIDLEHLSLDDKNPNYDPDARGWYDLELRNGELWGVCAAWTPDGERRLREKTQIYLSPSFPFDKTTKRVKWLHNVALTATPALNGIPALVAARFNAAEMSTKGDATMAEDNSKAIETMLKALGLDPKLPSKMATLLGLDAAASLEEIKSSLGKFEDTLSKLQAVANGDPAKVEDAPKTDTPAADAAPAADAPMAAASSSNEKLLSAVEKLTARIAQQDADAAALSAAKERSEFIASRKWPAEVLGWVNDAATPLVELQRLAANGNIPLSVAPVAGASVSEQGTRGAGAGEDVPARLRGKVDPAKYAEMRAAIAARKGI